MHRFIPPPLVVALFALLMWAAHRALVSGRFSFVGQRALASALLASGLLLMGAAAIAFMRARTTMNPMRPGRASRLIASGVFRFSRNPIYLGDVLILAALAVWLGQALNFVLLTLVICYLDRIQIRAEERALHELFGQTYRDYCARVRRWF